MKTLLSLLLLFGIVGGQAETPRPKCPSGLYFGAKMRMTAIRTNWCNPETGKDEMYECHLPEQNKTMRANQPIEEIRDGKRYITKCVADGEKGVSISSHFAEKDETCIDGETMYEADAQWNEGDYVKRCNPNTRRVEIIGCLGKDNEFIPRGENRTIKYTNQRNETVLEEFRCEAIGNEAKLRVKKIVQDISGECNTKIPHCEAKLADGSTVDKNDGDEWVIDALVYACIREADRPLSPVHVKVIGCVTPLSNFLKIGENATERVYEREFFKRYNSFCLPGGKNNATFVNVEENNRDAPDRNPVRSVPTCASGQFIPNGTLFFNIFGAVRLLCQIDHRGNITVTDGVYMRCRPTGESEDDKPAIIEPVPTCGNGRRVGEEWVVGKLVHACLEEETNKGQERIIGCLSYGGNFVKIGQNISEWDTMEGYNSHCLPVEGGAKLETQMVLDAYPPGVARPKFYEHREIQKCDQQQDARNGSTYLLDDIVVLLCQINHRGRKNISVVGCFDMDTGTILLGETAVLKGREMRCNPAVDGKAILEPVDDTTVPPEAKCANGKKEGEQWEEGLFELACRNDNQGRTSISVVSCIYKSSEGRRQRLPVGKSIDTDWGLTNLTCLPAEIISESGEKIQGAKLESEPMVFKCGNGKKMGEEWVDGGFLKACEDDGITLDGIEPIVVVKACISKIANEDVKIPVGENVTFPSGWCECTRSGTYHPSLPIVSAVLKCNPAVDGKAVLEPVDDRTVPPEAKCANGKKEGEQWEEDFFELGCRKDDQGRTSISVVSCIYKSSEGKMERLPLGMSTDNQNWGLTNLTCLPTELISATGEKIQGAKLESEPMVFRCDDGRKMGEEWIDGGFVKACEQDRMTLDMIQTMVVVKACIYETPDGGKRLAVGERRTIQRQSCECVRSDEPYRPELPVIRAAFKCNDDSITKLDCSKEENLDKEWVAGDFVRACKKIDGRNMLWEFVDIAYRCITPEGARIIVEEEQENPNGSVYDCVKVNRTEAKLVLLSAAKAALPRKCGNGRRLGGNWIDAEKRVELTCKLDKNGKPAVVVVACINPGMAMTKKDFRVPLVKTGYEFHRGTVKCVPTKDGSAKFEKVKEKCKNGKEIGEEWTDQNMLKKCESDNGMQDGGTVMAVKACIFSANESIAVGESKDFAGYGTCHCDRVDVNRNRDKQAREVNLWCESERPDCKRPENLDVEKGIITPFGKIVMACKSKTVTALKRNITTVEYKALRCITPLGDEITAGEQKIKNMILFKCHPLPVLGMLPGVRITMEKLDPHNATCDNGVPVGKQQIEGDVLKVCNQDLVWQAKGCVALTQGVEIYVGQLDYRLDMFYFCEKRGEFDAELVRKTPREICEKGYPALDALDYPRNSIPSWIENDYVKSCTLMDHDIDMMHVVSSIGCIVKEGEYLEIGAEKEYEKEGVRYKCEKVGDFEAQLQKTNITTIQKCENGLGVGDSQTMNGVELMCTHDLQLIAWLCVIPNKLLPIGETERENATQYSCEKRGEYSAELVIKSFSQLCEEGDTAVDAWISEGVLRDCDRKSAKPTVHARLCVLPDDRIIEVGENITEEFTTYKCERKGELDALLDVDLSKIHADYFTKSEICMNGKKIGEEWTEYEHVRRACHKRRGRKPVIVDLGCVLPDGRIINVGKKASWRAAATANMDEAIYLLNCKQGKRGFGAYAEVGAVDVPTEGRICKNEKFEGETWEDKNVLRTCKEVDDKLLVVALHCVFGNETLEIGELRKASDVSSIECVRMGQHDAAVAIDLVPTHDRACENDRKLNEEWTDEHFIRKACRIRNRKATIVALGCVLNDGRILAVGETDVKEEIRPGYIEYTRYTTCDKKGNDVIISMGHGYVKSQRSGSSCGKKEDGDVWATDKFLKKCKVVFDNTFDRPNGVHTAVTIGCITQKGTQMIEGEVVDEDDYHIVCKRDENDKLEMHYSFSIKEQ